MSMRQAGERGAERRTVIFFPLEFLPRVERTLMLRR